MVHTKAGIKHRSPCKLRSAVFTPSSPGWGKKINGFMFIYGSGHVAYQIKGKSVEQYASKMFDLMHNPDPLGWVKRSDIEIVRISIQVLAFQKSWRSFSLIIVCILAHCMLPF